MPVGSEETRGAPAASIRWQQWDEKPRTMLRYLRQGDLFAFAREGGGFIFGRLISKVSIGFVAEIFTYASSTPSLTRETVVRGERALDPLCLDTYSLFDRKSEGDWRIIGHQEGYLPDNDAHVSFVFGVPGSQRKIDLFGVVTPIDDTGADRLPRYSPHGDGDIQRRLTQRPDRTRN